MIKVFIFTNGGSPLNTEFFEFVTFSVDQDLASRMNQVAKDHKDSILVVWDHQPFEISELMDFAGSKDDVWHANSRNASVPDEEFLLFIDPFLNYRPDPPAGLDRAISWKVSPMRLFLRSHALHELRFDLRYESLSMIFADFGFRLLRGGGISRQRIKLGTEHPPHNELPMGKADPYLFIQKIYGRNAARYTFFRRISIGKNPIREFSGFRKARTFRIESEGTLIRELIPVVNPNNLKVSVVLPTYGRYPYLKEVLEDIRNQSIHPSQVIVADGNGRSPENERFYLEFSDLPLEVIWIEREGTCYSRNSCFERVRGDFIWIIDDDSRIANDNLEMHLSMLETYGIDVSVGPSYTKKRPELFVSQRNVSCTFLDCGTTVCRTKAVEDAGGFDMQYNNYLANEDGEFGIRIIKRAGAILNNPYAKRFHYLAPVGGARSSGNNIHRWKRWALSPRPVESIYYTGLKHFTRRARWEATWRSWLLSSRKSMEGKPKGFLTEFKYFCAEAIALPLSLFRLYRSVQLARKMFRSPDKEPYIKFNRS